MAIAFDAVGSVNAAGATVISKAHTVSGANTIFLATLYVAGTATLNSSPAFGGNPLTKITSITANSLNTEIWYLINPPAGLGTFNGTISASSNMILEVISLTGADQTNAILGSSSTSFTGATSGSVTRLNVLPNDWYVGAVGYNNSTFGTSNAGQTSRAKQGVFANSQLLDTNAGGGTLRWTVPSSNGVIVAAEVNASRPITIAGSVGTIVDAASVSGTYTFSGGANRALIVGAGAHQNDVGTVTLNGTMLTKVIQGTTQFNEQFNLWYYNNPPASSPGTISISANGAAGVGFIAAEFNGVSQVSQPAGSSNSNLGNSVTALGTLTTTTDNNWIIGGFYAEALWSSEKQAPIQHISAQSFEAMAMSYLPLDTAGIGTMSWTLASGQRWGVAMLSLESVTAAPSGTSNAGYRTLVGVGI